MLFVLVARPLHRRSRELVAVSTPFIQSLQFVLKNHYYVFIDGVSSRESLWFLLAAKNRSVVCDLQAVGLGLNGQHLVLLDWFSLVKDTFTQLDGVITSNTDNISDQNTRLRILSVLRRFCVQPYKPGLSDGENTWYLAQLRRLVAASQNLDEDGVPTYDPSYVAKLLLEHYPNLILGCIAKRLHYSQDQFVDDLINKGLLDSSRVPRTALTVDDVVNRDVDPDTISVVVEETDVPGKAESTVENIFNIEGGDIPEGSLPQTLVAHLDEPEIRGIFLTLSVLKVILSLFDNYPREIYQDIYTPQMLTTGTTTFLSYDFQEVPNQRYIEQ